MRNECEADLSTREQQPNERVAIGARLDEGEGQGVRKRLTPNSVSTDVSS